MSVLQDAKHHATPSQTSDAVRLARVPQKRHPVFGKDHAQTKNLDRDPIQLNRITV
jgi:hypothetical protein